MGFNDMGRNFAKWMNWSPKKDQGVSQQEEGQDEPSSIPVDIGAMGQEKKDTGEVRVVERAIEKNRKNRIAEVMRLVKEGSDREKMLSILEKDEEIIVRRSTGEETSGNILSVWEKNRSDDIRVRVTFSADGKLAMKNPTLKDFLSWQTGA